MKKKNIAAVCAVAGVCVLTSAAFASYQTANGYDTLKKSLLNSIDYTNCTVTGAVKVSFDGTELVSGSYGLEADYPNQRSHTFSSSSAPQLDSEDYTLHTYEDNGYYYYQHFNEDGEADGLTRHELASDPQQTLLGISEGDRNTADKVIRFMELAADTVVGDLRNNFVCTEDADDHATYSITLDSVQIPEIINAGLSMMFSIANTESTYITYDENGEPTVVSYDENDLEYYILRLGTDPVVDNLTLSFTAGKDGNFRDGNAAVSFKGTDADGSEHTMTFDVELSFSDIGTTSVTPPSELGIDIYEYSDYDGSLTKVTF